MASSALITGITHGYWRPAAAWPGARDALELNWLTSPILLLRSRRERLKPRVRVKITYRPPSE